MAIELVALAPLALGTLRWREANGAPRLTIIAKATFEIAPGKAARPIAPFPLFGDLHYEENDGRSLRVASDFVPRKAAADVLFTGAVSPPDAERVPHRTVPLPAT